MTCKLPSHVKLQWFESKQHWVLQTKDGHFLADGNAPDKAEARRQAWTACEEMGLVTDE